MFYYCKDSDAKELLVFQIPPLLLVLVSYQSYVRIYQGRPDDVESISASKLLGGKNVDSGCFSPSKGGCSCDITPWVA